VRCEDCGHDLGFQLHCPRCDGSRWRTPIAVVVILLVFTALLMFTLT
jgi:hypothetical protein